MGDSAGFKYHQPDVLTPWDVQSKRVYGTDDAGPTLPSGTGEGMNIQPIVLQSDGSNGQAVAFRNDATPKVSGEGIALTLKLGGQGGTLDCVAFAQNQRDEVRLEGL